MPTGRTAIARPAAGRIAALLAIVLLAVAGAVAGPSPAGAATSIRDLLDEYRTLGEIDACSHDLRDLQAAKDKIGSDSGQYSPEFATAIDKAIAERGSCPEDRPSGKGTTTEEAAPPPVENATPPPAQAPPPTPTTTREAPATPSPGPVTTPAPVVARDDLIATTARPPIATHTAAWTWAAIGGAILLLALLGWTLVTATGRIRWLQPIGHAMGEAGWRIGARWAEFTDWLRLGGGR